jgi:HTH-type transcriptional regulator/antitoxin HipB
MIARTPEDLGLLIRTRRHELGLDQQALATRIGVSRLWVIEFERGKPRAEIGLVMRALLALDLRLDVASPDAVSSPTPKKKSANATAYPDIDAVVQNARKRR